MMDWVMIVDDDATSLEAASQALNAAGIRVTAMQSGRALIDYLNENPALSPDLVLLDSVMPGQDGFETLKALRRAREGRQEIPVIFLSADHKEEAETRGLQLGALDFIRKPLVPEILVSRVQNALRTQEKLQQLERSAMIDRMTGFLNKDTAEDRMEHICQTEAGFLCVLDLDSFKLINDLYGHDVGDRTLILFSNLLKNNMRTEDVCGRIGGDEFILFAKNMRTESELRRFTERINKGYIEMMKRLLREDQLKLPMGVSIGAAAVPAHGQDYRKLFHLADQALNTVKQNGKHGCALNGSPQMNFTSINGALNLEAVTMILEERNISTNAMWMGREAFINIYRYMMRYMERYHGVAYRVLFTIRPVSDVGREGHVDIVEQFRQMVQESLRNSDVMVEVSQTQIFLLLPETHDNGIDVVTERLMRKWRASEYCDKAVITWEAGPVHLTPHDDRKSEKRREDRVVAVGAPDARGDVEAALAAPDVRVTGLDSAEALFGYLKDNPVDLILLEAGAPDADAAGTLRRLKNNSWRVKDIPVVLVTSEATRALEVAALRMGAEDCVRRPFDGEMLAHRVRRAIERCRLEDNLAHEAMLRTEESQDRLMHIVSALTTAIDARDTYAAGHSMRVAGYARRIAERCGYSDRKLSEIYMMGLLHDVGNLAVSEDILNKPAALTPAEYDSVREHTLVGAKTLEEFSEMPSLALGARWHHERYDGKGYPDGLMGENIPEEARIIAVAEAYDAMNSRRAYRDRLAPEAIRDAREQGAGAQFDPRFARIMLELVEEDENE
ncbi:MAG: response regulator [Clostridia bacterium]|nr:response regulator [Clostridia bacterium]